MSKINILDIFSGPGGLGEGFTSFTTPAGERPFQIAFSAECHAAAVRTLRLRTFYRWLKDSNDNIPPSYYEYLRGARKSAWDSTTESLWHTICEEIQPLELGTKTGDQLLNNGIHKHLSGQKSDWVLIGGPPCQAYSLAGRSRNKGIAGYRPEKDERHFLYREYLKILEDHQPIAFVMENVKGILSSQVKNKRIFPQILRDLSSPGNGRNGVRYRIHSLVSNAIYAAGDDPEALDPREFIIRAEDYGIPQARHRVILVGIRDDGPSTPRVGQLKPSPEEVRLETALLGLPDLRSGLSKGDTDAEHWKSTIARIFKSFQSGLPREHSKRMSDTLDLISAKEFLHDRGGRFIDTTRAPSGSKHEHKGFLANVVNPDLKGVPNHFARGHMPEDLVRYLFASTFAAHENRSPKAQDFPEALAPAHKSWKTGNFTDRFRVQLASAPSTTILSHLSKDGHYFIHPDPVQCRSLTVREAARLQTFPDDYFFEGNRTEQYVQVGNAVPPMLARQIAELVFQAIN